MSTLLAGGKIEFSDLSAGIGLGSPSTGGVAVAPSSASKGGDVLQFPQFPNFSYPTNAVTVSTKLAGRINASAIKPSDHKSLLEERQWLLDRELSGTMTAEEKNRLDYVRWSLDRVDDARFGLDLERLDSLVSRYEMFHTDIKQFWTELQRLKQSSGARR